MKNLKLIALLLILTNTAFAIEKHNCTDKKIEVKAKGFMGYGAEAQKEKSIGRISSTTSAASTYQRSFETGRYRFVKESDAWAIYRKNDQDVYELRKDIKFPVKVSIDQPIYVSQRDKNVLEIRRNTDDKNSTSMTVVFGPAQMNVKDRDGKEILSYSLCPTSNEHPAAASDATNIKTHH